MPTGQPVAESTVHIILPVYVSQSIIPSMYHTVFELDLIKTFPENSYGQEVRCGSPPHSEHCFLTPSSKPCQNCLCHWRGTFHLCAAVHWRCQHPLKVLGTNETMETYQPSTHINMRHVHLRLKKVSPWLKKFGVYLCWHKQCRWLSKKCLI